MPRHWLIKLRNPRWGRGTICEAFWCFCDLVPTLVDATRASGGELEMQNAIVRFGTPATKFIHKIVYERRE